MNKNISKIAWDKTLKEFPEYENWWNFSPIYTGGNISINFDQLPNSNCARFNCEQHNIKINFGNSSKTFYQAQNDLTDLFVELHAKLLNKMRNNDFIRLVFYHSDFKEGPIRYPFMSKETFQSINLLNNFNSVVQSYREIKINENQNMHGTAIIAHLPSGSGRNSYKNKDYKNQQDFLDNSIRSIIPIENNDNLCGLRSVIIAIAVYEKDEQLNFLLKKNSPFLHKRVKKIAKKCNLKNKPMGINEFKILEKYFKYYQITIINGDLNQDYIYIGPQNKKCIYICYTNSHYHVIKSMKHFLNRQYFCDICKKGYTNKNTHICPGICKSCHRRECLDDIEFDNCIEINLKLERKCKGCYMIFKNETCGIMHVENYCTNPKKCDVCNKILKKNHVCGLNSKWCSNCKKSVDYDHQCYILNEKVETNDSIETNYIFFDYECMPLDNKHVPNLIVCEKVCINCINNLACNSFCKMHKFYDNDSFCDWLFSLENSNCIAVAHNMKGYDGIFILNYIVESFVSVYSKPEILINGTKILSLKYKNVKVIDSLSFLPMPLDKFTKTFDLKELKKGFFPHKFNTLENQNYVGKIPDKNYFSAEYFSLEKTREFEKWYDDNSNVVYDFKKELEEYCISDVKLLKEGCLKFRKILLEKTGVDPFKKCITIASLCHYIFRKNMMIKDSIAIIPSNGYNPEQKCSIKALKWLAYLSEKNNIYIQHARNGGEKRLDKYLLDGYSEHFDNGKMKRTIYEFHGCLFHGCPKCYKKTTWNPIKNELMGTTYARHLNRINYIKNNMLDHIIIECWECEFDKLCKTDSELKTFLNERCQYKDPINPRDALFGGRTNSVKLYHKCLKNEKIKYVDFTSLYPYVQKYCDYPLGHPKLITENFCKVEEYFGIIKCLILPPRRLHLPVLPAKINNKLIFTLCSKCAELKQKICNHSNNERALFGTWVTLEVQKALICGYQIIKIYEVWHWEKKSKYNKDTKSGGLFTEYIDMFLKLKQEASGFPEEVVTENDKNEYIENYYNKEGIMLDKSNIKLNPGMRTVTKLMLNSFWGRYAMNSNKTQIKFISKVNDWYELINDDRYIIEDVNFNTPNVLTVYYSIKNNIHEGSNQVNVAIAAFVTCHARLKLYSELELIGDRVLYFDTDSIIFISNNKDYEPKTGNFLGELTNEIDKKDGNYIEEIICPGPKNYQYKLDTGKQKCVIKGFSLNCSTALSLNFDSIKNIVFHNREKKIQVEQLKFSRDKNNWSIQTSIINKLYSFVYDKRVVCENFETIPYGY